MTCWNGCKSPVVTTVCGTPVCQACADHYLGYDKEQKEPAEYITADVAVDLRGF